MSFNQLPDKIKDVISHEQRGRHRWMAMSRALLRASVVLAEDLLVVAFEPVYPGERRPHDALASASVVSRAYACAANTGPTPQRFYAPRGWDDPKTRCAYDASEAAWLAYCAANAPAYDFARLGLAIESLSHTFAALHLVGEPAARIDDAIATVLAELQAEHIGCDCPA